MEVSQVLICLEALSDRTTKAKRGSPRLIVVPAFYVKGRAVLWRSSW